MLRQKQHEVLGANRLVNRRTTKFWSIWSLFNVNNFIANLAIACRLFQLLIQNKTFHHFFCTLYAGLKINQERCTDCMWRMIRTASIRSPNKLLLFDSSRSAILSMWKSFKSRKKSQRLCVLLVWVEAPTPDSSRSVRKNNFKCRSSLLV